MKILLYGINYAPELTGIGKYSGELGSWLVSRGYDIKVVTAPPYYPDWSIQKPYSGFSYRKESFDNAEVLRCPIYVPSSPGFLKRILHLLSFSLSSAPVILSTLRWKPDVVFCVVPSAFCVPVVLLFCAITGSRSIVHVQDYEVDAMLGSGVGTEGFLARVARWYERFALTRSDYVSTISRSMMDKAIEKGVDTGKLLFFPNWSEINRFQSVNPEDIEVIRQKFGLSSERKVCLYSGNIGDKQGLEILIEVAASFAKENVDFVFVGQGAGLSRLKQLASSVVNISFFPLQPYEDLPALLGLADCHLVVQKAGVADAVLPSKLTNILAVGGQALITAEENTELGKLCVDYPDIAELIEPEDSHAIEQGIRRVLLKPKINNIAQRYAEENLDKEAVLTKFESDLFNLIKY